eukprot:m.207273 g.207273  ORF g.207273 m.207273 type:complete len:109 (-) comp17122_c0_seq11:29-355(-)
MNQRDTGMLTPLMLAARNGHTQCIMALVKDFNADVTATDFNGFAVLHWLASNGRADPLELLLNDGFDIGTQDKHSRVKPIDPDLALMLKTFNGHVQCRWRRGPAASGR